MVMRSEYTLRVENLRVPDLEGIVSCRQTGSFSSGEVKAIA